MDELEIETRDGALAIRLRVSPGARKARIIGPHGGALKLSVTEPPEDGRANEGVIKLLANTLDIPATNIKITAGHTSRDKRATVRGMSASELRAAIASRPGGLMQSDSSPSY